MSNLPYNDLLACFLQTLQMVGLAGAISLGVGLPLALLLVVTDRRGIMPNLFINRVVGTIANAVRSVPFIILLVAVIPLTRLVVGTAIGTMAAIVPLAIAATPYYARIAEVSLRGVDGGLVEAVRAMGGGRMAIVREVFLPEALPGLISGFVVTLVTLIGASAMAGVVGAGGLGDLAIRYGYDEFQIKVVVAVVAILIAFVWVLQFAGDRLAAHFDRR
ncbi:MAG TPA: methionine ABC transporter permease [Acidocella sp.]|jgi:D-methionine transport system permease protein|uniref:methionine ABC transporter permease n=1 Tax=Acidocella sp. TaxID=50710 RepID=UPI002CEFBFB0|nr:methionine ABC transporter permease [Acidocella sp.]HVE22966.1 methionine ABC transporter permease [Acidocella sp.]